MRLAGSCHCGKIRVELETAIPPEETVIRLCQCSFCTKHGARAMADPGGRVSISVTSASHLHHYRFGLRTADFLVCAGCGVYLAAFMPADGDHGALAVLNTNVLADRGRFIHPGAPMDYDGEDVDTRLARRRQRWMPAELITGTAA